MKRLLFCMIAAIAALSVNSAIASTITIGISPDGATITQAGPPSSSGLDTVFGSNFGFSYSITGTAPPFLISPDLLDSNTIDVAGSSGSLYVYVTEQGITSPAGLETFLSEFTSNNLPPGWSLTEETLIDTADGLFTGTLLSSHLFSAIGGAAKYAGANTGTDYSVTEEYIITANGRGTTNDTVDLSTTPLPGALSLFAGGLGLMCFAGWSKRRKATRALSPGRMRSV